MRKSYKLLNHEYCKAHVEIHFDENNHATKIELWSYNTRVCGAYKPLMMVGHYFALALILKLRAVKFHGFLVNHGNLRDNGNCLMDFSRK